MVDSAQLTGSSVLIMSVSSKRIGATVLTIVETILTKR